MDVPGIVRERLDDERRLTSVNVGGDDRVYVTPPRTLVYHAAGLFSSESVEEFPHEVHRFDLSADRREATFAFEYGDDVRAFSTPRERIETVLPPVLAGVLQATGHIEPDESIEESYRFGDRTLVVTDTRVLTSVGEAVWDSDHASYEYADVTGLRFEDGVLGIDIDGRSRRIELAGDGQREAYETVENALLAYHGVSAAEELPQPTADSGRQGTTAAEWSGPATGGTRAAATDDAETDTEPDVPPSPSPRSSAPGDSPDPSIREVPESDDRGTPTGATAGSTSAREDALAGELDALRESVERQTELLERQQETLERLADELGARVSDDR